MARGRTGRSGRSRGEVNEVVNQLEQLSALDGRKPDVVQAKRDCFQKLIKYMTAGIDMSTAFIPATKCVALSKFDLPLKKMLYLYLRSAARQNSAVALLVVQTLLTDAKDADPTIRGLAVRSMCSLRVPDIMENVFAAVDAGLKDSHPYVREVTIIGVLKCHYQDAAGTKMRGYIDTVRSMLASDTDPQVVANCLYVLQQLGALNPTVVSRQLVVSLLNNIRSFSDWAQCLVLDILLKYYRPGSEAERFDVLEVLDFGLNHTNSAVVMATAKLFLHYTSSYPEQHGQVLASIRGPLQTLLLGKEPEIVFAALSNLIILAQRHPSAFSDLAPDFFCRPEDPSYLKLLKLDALVAVADASNAFDAAEEASQYARDVEGDVVRAAVRAVAHIALKVAEVDGILDRLLLFLGHSREEVAEEAVAAMADVLRRFPDAANACVPAVAEMDESTLKRPSARAAFVWVLGEFGHTVQDAPYTLESMVFKYPEQAPEVKRALLSSVAKLFFKRAPECRAALEAVLAAGTEDGDVSVRERAQFYHRLFQDAGPEEAKSIIAPLPPILARFEDSQPAEVQDRIFDEWNSLSTIYRAPAATFIDHSGDARGAEREEIDSIGGGDDVGGVISDLLDIGLGIGGDSMIQEVDMNNGDNDASAALLLDISDEPKSAALGGDVSDIAGLNGSVSSSSRAMDTSATDLLAMNLSSMGLDAAPRQQQATPAGDMLGGFFGSDGGGVGGVASDAGANTALPASSFGALDGLGGLESLSNPTPAAPMAIPSSALGDELDAFFGGGGGGAAPPQPHHQYQQTITLASKPSISPTEFSSCWSTWESSGSVLSFKQEVSSLAAITARGFKDFSEHIEQANISSFATPKEGSVPPLRFLLHAQQQGGNAARVLAQITVTTTPQHRGAGAGAAEAVAEVVVKSNDAGVAMHVQELLQTLLITL
ncbi:hypothetical protein Ndes2437B_g07893 [Nannochloris sp. 'desiccata']